MLRRNLRPTRRLSRFDAFLAQIEPNQAVEAEVEDPRHRYLRHQITQSALDCYPHESYFFMALLNAEISLILGLAL